MIFSPCSCHSHRLNSATFELAHTCPFFLKSKATFLYMLGLHFSLTACCSVCTYTLMVMVISKPNIIICHSSHIYLRLHHKKTCWSWQPCNLKHTHQCVSRLQEYWSLSIAAWNRVAWTMLNWVLLTPDAISHTCCSCVHHGLYPTSKLRQSDNLLHQQSELLWSPEWLSPQSVSLCGSSPRGAFRVTLFTDTQSHLPLGLLQPQSK